MTRETDCRESPFLSEAQLDIALITEYVGLIYSWQVWPVLLNLKDADHSLVTYASDSVKITVYYNCCMAGKQS